MQNCELSRLKMKIQSLIILVIITFCNSYNYGQSHKGKCIDARMDCDQLKKYGWCTTRETTMKQICRETCKFCSNQCYDNRKDCSYLRSLGWCKYQSKGMAKVCAKTCLFCEKNKPKQLNLKSAIKTKPVEQLKKRPSEVRSIYCKDNLKKVQCEYYKYIGWCDRRNMKHYCKKTCICDRKVATPSCNSSPYGCCQDNKTTKLSTSGLGCPPCKDDPRYHSMCKRFRSDCNGKGGFAKSIRKYCFQTCKLCYNEASLCVQNNNKVSKMVGEVEDLDMLFEILDTDFKGYLTFNEIQLFEESTFFEALDSEQIYAALNSVCGHDDVGSCDKNNFRHLLLELERRRNLENKIKWDFNALDCDFNDRISLQAALFLFKSVHVERFSINLWNSFLSSRIRPEEEVSFHEIKMFLCNIPQNISYDHETYDQFSSQVRENQIERDYNFHQSLVAWQEDEAAIAVKEREKQFRSTQLKQSADHLIHRLEDIGMQALLEEDHVNLLKATEKPYERINASDLLNALKDKYDMIRDHLLLEMLKIQIGEGMLAALSLKEQNERLFQVRIKEENLRKEGKHDEMIHELPGTGNKYKYSLLWLMGESLSENIIKEQNIQNKMLESGMERDEILQEFEKKIEFAEKQSTTTDELLLQLNERLILEKDMISNRLQGIGDTTLNIHEREHLFCLLFMMQLRAFNEKSFENAALSVGLTERSASNIYEINSKERQRQEQLAMKRLLMQKSQKTTIKKALFNQIIEKRKEIKGRIDIQMEIIQNMEKRLLVEREVFMNFLQGKDNLQYRIKAKKLSSEERSNQLLVLKTQWQGWQHRSKEDKIQTLEQHRNILQEAVSIVFENKKEELRIISPNTVDDLTVSCNLLSSLQLNQECESKRIIDFSDKQSADLDRLCNREIRSYDEEWFENIAAVIFDIKDISDEEEEIIKALNDKYDAVRDKLLLEALKKQMSDAEWAKLSEQERQAKLMKLKLMERRLRRDGKYDEAAAILGDAFKNAEHLQSLLGASRQRYLDKIQERLKSRKKRILEGNDEEEEDDNEIDDDELNSTGNILKDLQMRYEQEKDALLRRLQEGEGKYLNEKERQAELMRLRLEKRKAEREGNFEGAALVLGIAERNSAARAEGLRKDRERQEKLAKERLEARRNAKRKRQKELEEPEPNKDDDISIWQDSVMKELEKKQIKERDFLAEILSDPDINDLCDEARNMNEDERSERISKLKDKRDELDFEDSSDQEEHGAILELASSVKMIIRESNLSKSSQNQITQNDIAVSLMADLQQVQDKETTSIMQQVQNKTQEELADLRIRQIKSRNYEELSNVAEVIFAYEGKSSDNEIMKALDKKYDALMDKLILEGLQKQLGDAQWQAMSEKERQAELIKRRLEQKRLLRDGKLEEAAKLLGEGFEVDASLRKLMGQNRSRYEEMVKEKLAKRKERQRLGIETNDDDDDDDMLEIDESEEGIKIDAKTLLEDMQNRYEDEKEALMMKLKGADAKFYSEKQRQAELARLRREERKVKLEEKFGTAAMVLGLAERNQAALESKLKSDRARQEQLAKERLEKLREKRRSKQKEMKIIKDGDISSLKENAMQCIEYRHTLERQDLVEIFREERNDEFEKAKCMTFGNREERLQELKNQLMGQIMSIEKDKWMEIIKEMSALKEVNLLNRLEKDGKMSDDLKNDVIVSLIADLQEVQDEECEQEMQRMLSMERDDIIALQENEIEMQKLGRWKNLVKIISAFEKINVANDEALVDALKSKYETLKDKLILEALEKKLGAEQWDALNENEKFNKLMEVKLKIKQLLDQGKVDELNEMMTDLFADEINLKTLMNLNAEAEAERMEEKERLRKERREAGMSEDEINELERKEDEKFEEELRKKSPKNALLHLEHNFEAEKDALFASMRGANAKLANERERQVELARLKREQRRAKKEDHFESAALVLSLAKTQKDALESKLKSDRERQEKLAKERLLARKNQRQKSKKIDSVQIIEDSDDIVTLQEKVLSEMEMKHTDEREFLLQSIQDSHGSVWNSNAKQLDIVSKQQRLNELKMLRMQWRDMSQNEMSENINEQMDIFKEAICLKIQMIIDEKSSTNGKEEDEELIEKATIRILADLQEKQDKEAEHLLKDLSQKTLLTLKQLCKVHRMSRDEKWYDNIASCLLGINNIHGSSEKTSENEIVDALDSKYSELKEKLFVDILKSKYGESEWENMSKEQQQKLLQELRNEEKQLRNGEELTNSIFNEFTLQNDLSDGNASDLLKNILNEYNAEKDAILASLKDADAKMLGEKERQEALFKLRREQRKLKREDKFDSAAIIFNMAQQNKKQQDISFDAERKRQKDLAMKRIAAARRKKPLTTEHLYEKILQEQQIDIQNDIRYTDEIQREGVIAMKNIVLEEMEKKHIIERETLVELLSFAESDEDAKMAANYLTKSQKDEKFTLLRNEKEKWKQISSQAIVNQTLDSDMTEDEKLSNAKRIAESWEEFKRILLKALVIKTEEMKQSLIAKGFNDKQLSDEVSIILLADLQERQSSENNALDTVMIDKSQDFLLKVKDDQRKQRREKWMENISNLLLGVSAPVRKHSSSKAPEMSNISEEMEGLEEMLEEEEKQQFESLQKEMENEKQKRNLHELSEDEMSKVLSDLQKQQEAKRQAILSSIEKQRDDARRRLEEKRRKRDEKQYEEDIALSIISAANTRSNLMMEKTNLQKKTQKDSLEDRLRRRREERKIKLEKESQKMKQEEEEEEENERRRKEESQKSIKPISLPGGGLRREKTVVEEAAEMDDSQKKEIVGVLMREQTTLALRLNREQTRQEEKVKFLRSQRRQKQEQREQEAATIIGIGERQKTIVASQTKSERERQIASVKSRVARIKYERTLTVKEPTDPNAAGFDQFLNDNETEGLTEDEKMAEIARKMEQKLRQEGEGLKNEDISVTPELSETENEDENALRGVKLDEKMQVQKLKDRYLQKKKSRKNKNEEIVED